MQPGYPFRIRVNYAVAVDILKKSVMGDLNVFQIPHIEELLNMSVSKQPRVSILGELYDKLPLEITSEQHGVLSCPLILSRLPPDLRFDWVRERVSEWTRESENHEGDLEWLLKFLQNEISMRERSQSVIKQESHSAVR